MGVFSSVIFPIFNGVCDKKVIHVKDEQDSPDSQSAQPEGSTWDAETSAIGAQCLVDLFICFFDVVRSELPNVISILTGFIRNPIQGPASTGVAALLHLASELSSRLSQDEWREIFLALKDAAASTLPSFMKLLKTMDDIEIPNTSENGDMEMNSEHGSVNDELEDDNLQTASYVISRMKSHIAVQLLITQVLSLSFFEGLLF